jgi:hypothetical protein
LKGKCEAIENGFDDQLSLEPGEPFSPGKSFE